MRPLPTSFPSYFNTYIKLIPESDVMEALRNHAIRADKFFNFITEEQSFYKYSEGKWTVKEILQHVIDTERIFCYRALAIARKEIAPLPSFDERKYSANSLSNQRPWKDLTEEFKTVRQASVLLFHSFTNESLERSGKVSDYQMTVLALGFTIAGHVEHHMNIIRERYHDVAIP